MHDRDLASWLRRESEVEGKAESYEWLEEIGSGGMGRVYRARIIETGEVVAVKVLLPIVERSAKPKRRFRRELQALLRLDHPNIVRLRDGGWIDVRPFLVMDWVDGVTLAEAVTERLRAAGKPDFEATRRHLAAVASALQLCHSVDLVHRDIKPSNIMIRSEDKTPVLIDFGLVRPAGRKRQSDRLTQTGEIVGTPAYASPEQIGALHGVGPPADVWGFGATLYFCLTGREPFEGSSHFEIFSQIVTALPTPPRELFPDVPAELEELAAACLRKKAEQRPGWDHILRVLRGPEPRPARRPRSGPIPILAGALMLAASVAAALLMSGEAPGPAFRDFEPTDPTVFTSARTLEVSGGLSSEVRSLRVGARRLPIDAGGRFRTLLPLGPEGSAGFDFVAFSAAGAELGRKRLRVRVDRSPPIIQLDGDGGQGLIRARDAWRLSGAITDSGPVRLSLIRESDGAALAGGELKSSGAFSLKVPPSERMQRMRLEARDQSGNSATRRLIYCGPEVSRYVDECLNPGVYRSLQGALRDLETWLEASGEERRQLADSVWLRSLDTYDFLGFERYGPRRVPIAAYRHRASGIRLHLVPGARLYQARFATARMILAMLEDLAEDELVEVINFTVERRYVTPQMLRTLGGAVRGRPFESGEELQRYLRESGEGRAIMRRFVQQYGELYDNTAEGQRPQVPSMLDPEPGEARLPEKRYITVAPFLIGRAEVSRDQWRRLIEGPKAAGVIEDGALPITDLGLRDISEVLARSAPLRLPGRDEWRCAARAGAPLKEVWGADSSRRRALQDLSCWHRSNAGRRLRPASDHEGRENAFGLIDILGNASEIVAEITLRVRFDLEERYWPIMGGNILTPAALLYPDLYRLDAAAVARSDTIGLRLAADLPR